MDQLPVILSAVGSVFAVVGIGLLVRWLGWLTEEADHSLIRLTIRVFFPALIITNIARNTQLRPSGELALAMGSGFGLVVLGFGIAGLAAMLFGKWLGLDSRAKMLTFTLCAGIYNYGYIPIPLATTMYKGNEQTLSMLLIHNVGVEIALYSVGIAILNGRLSKQALKGIANPLAIAIVVALSLNWSGTWASPHFPGWVKDFIGWIGAAAVPVSLILVGATMADVWRKHRVTSGFNTVGGAVLVRMLILPVLMLLIGYALPVSADLKHVFILQSAMPAAAFTVVLTRHYGGDILTAVRVVIWTHVVGLLTIPVWLVIGTNVLGR